MASSYISPYASDQRKAQWEKATGLKAPANPSATKTPAKAAAPVVNLTTRTYAGSAPASARPSTSAPVTTNASVSTIGARAAAAAATGTIDPVRVGQENANTFLSIVGGLPENVKNRYLSAFADFQSLSPDKQSGYLAALDQTAKDIVAPKMEQDRTRLQEDLDYAINQRKAQKLNIENTLNTVLTQLDFNKNRDIAKTNQNAAKAFQNVTNTAFVTGVAGSGIFSRRNALVREGLQQGVEDINIDWSQNRLNSQQKAGQADQALDSEISRLNQLNTRDVSDLDQQQKSDEMSIFLSLLGSKVGQTGTQDANALLSGVGSKTGQETTGSPLDAYMAGGTDADRQKRYATQDRYLRMTPDEIIAEKFKPEELTKLATIESWGQVSGEAYGRKTFRNKGYGEENPSGYEWDNTIYPQLQLLNQIRSGEYQKSIKSSLNLK